MTSRLVRALALAALIGMVAGSLGTRARAGAKMLAQSQAQMLTQSQTLAQAQTQVSAQPLPQAQVSAHGQTQPPTEMLAQMQPQAHSQASAPVAASGGAWQTLFDGKDTDAFRGWISGVLPAGWHVEDGLLTKQGNVEDLLTRKQYGSFELELEWKIGKEGNSGVLYRVTREYDHLYWSGPEYQLLDDANAPDGRSQLTATGAAYGIYPAPAGIVKPFGEWNATRIVVNGEHVEHWLNGRKVVSYELGSAEWKARVAASKFSKYPNYGLAKRGSIGIQGDHPGALALRHIRIRELP